jgi:hypothetical protein
MVLKDFNRGTYFTIGTSSDSKFILNLKFGNSRSIFNFGKLIKIARNGLKI